MFDQAPLILGFVPDEFILFALVLAGIALLQRHTLEVAITGLAAVTLYKLEFTGFPQGPGLTGLAALLAHEWVILANLFALLMGFALLSKHFEDSKIPAETAACGCEQRNVILIARPALGFFGASRERARHPSPCAKS
jgi:hypothetical protein